MASHMGKGSRPAGRSPHGILVAIVGCALLVCGIAMVVRAFAPDPDSNGRPRESVRADLSFTEHEPDSHYDSGYRWWGTYVWSYQGSTGYYEASKGYESKVDVPRHHTVHIYLGEDDTWYTVEGREAGGLLVGGVALVAVGVAGIVFGILMRRANVAF